MAGVPFRLCDRWADPCLLGIGRECIRARRDATAVLLDASRVRRLTGRGIVRLCRIARTVADLDESEYVGARHVLEGSQLQGRRGLDEREDRFEIRLGERGYPGSVAELPDAPRVLYVRGAPGVPGGPVDLDYRLASRDAVRGSPSRSWPQGSLSSRASPSFPAGPGMRSGGGPGGARCGRAACHRLGNRCGRRLPRERTPTRRGRALIEGDGRGLARALGDASAAMGIPEAQRVIASLSDATFVAEAGMPSGTFSTAETANALGRELIAVPGSSSPPNREEPLKSYCERGLLHRG